MSNRLRIAILAGCLFVISLHLEQGGRLLREVWRGPYLGAPPWSGAVTQAAVGARRSLPVEAAERDAELASALRVASSK